MGVNAKRRIGTALIGLGALAGSVLAASPAQAAPDGWVYVVIGNWNCPNGGTITQITGAVWTTWTYRQMWSGGDAGDNIIYPKVELKVSNTFDGRAFCAKGTASQWINVYRDFTPSYTKQTIWL
ncbi:hypothetical protein [Micromonospora inositola]|uniref:Peptidase inhibitor family I36 n=1 Tax=Micromonospora inositola TaxID=47865 RepID=A0A1C5K3R1_9ACTN|nr:hypothetical protein [Micromonospora inositola]SCG77442.1 hypothetical protein GA0070613_6265 [Micromonospora inositola]